MLNELYRYAQSSGAMMPPGFKQKRIKYYVSLSLEGEYCGVLAGGDESVLAPDLGSAAQGGNACNILAEKFGIVFCLPEKNGEMKSSTPAKHRFFVDALEDGAAFEPAFGVCARMLLDDDARNAVAAEMMRGKVKPEDIVGFAVDGLRLESSARYRAWWDGFRAFAQKGGAITRARCFITGDLTEPLLTTPKIAGLRAVGGHTSNDALICFDKDAFCSFGFDQAQNAAVSEAAMFGIRGALEQLISDAPILAGSKFLHWYQEPLDKGEDVVEALIGRDLFAGSDEDDEPAEENAQAERAADRRTVTALVRSILAGEHPRMPQNRYHILSLSGAGGRIMVRGYLQGQYEDLYRAVKAWFEDLRLHNSADFWAPKRLTQYYYQLLKPVRNSRTPVSERMANELAGLDAQMLYAIIGNAPLPDAMAAKALRTIRSSMLAGSQDAGEGIKRAPVPNQSACSLLKAWLIRMDRKNRHREVSSMTAELNADYPGIAYHLGRMMAVYAKLQLDASGRVNAGVVERYYAAACTKPALVMGRLAQLSGHHLSKLDERASAYYKRLLSDISLRLTPELPTFFNLREQAEFAIGYYQQNAFLYQKRTDLPAQSAEEAEPSDQTTKGV